jgi:aminocarboxymuconate-semialdehyde decarboxylase
MRSYYLPVLVGNPSEISLAAASMIFGGVLERHRRLKVCFAHGGGFIPYQIGRLDRGYEVRSESRAAARARPSSFLGRVYFDTIVYNESALSFLVSSIGARNILLGSDSPLDMHDHRIVKKVRGLSSCSKKEKEMILGDNIERLVRL